MIKELSTSEANQRIDKLIDLPSVLQGFENIYTLRRAITNEDWQYAASQKSSVTFDAIKQEPFYFCVLLTSKDSAAVSGAVTFFVAYSTWDGRTLFVDKLKLPEEKYEALEKSLLQMLAKIALDLSCTRLAWKHTKPSSWYSDDSNPPEILNEWLNLSMGQSAMENYASDFSGCVEALVETSDFEVETIKNCVAGINQTVQGKFELRLAEKGDIDTIVRLVHGLAAYEREPDAVNLTGEDYLRDGYSEQPLFRCLMLDFQGDDGQVHPCGMAFFYFGFNIESGRFLYLEDLFIEESYRKGGGGSLAMKSLARIALSLGCKEFRWVALDWNTPALNLYKKIGATVEDDVLITRYCSERLKEFAT